MAEFDDKCCKCIKKYRNQHNQIIGYVIEDKYGNFRGYYNNLECQKAGIYLIYTHYGDINTLKKQMASGGNDSR